MPDTHPTRGLGAASARSKCEEPRRSGLTQAVRHGSQRSWVVALERSGGEVQAGARGCFHSRADLFARPA